jgi:poly(3-hydroxybutyrate) depolymerase
VNRTNFDQLAAQLVAHDERVNVQPPSKAQDRIENIGGRTCTVREYVRDGRLYLRSFLIEGLGHAWSGGDPAYPFNDGAGPLASDLIWDFVSRYSRDERATRPS